MQRRKGDEINHPSHYNSHPSGVECITVAEHLSFNLGNAMKYIWRFEGKDGVRDLKKAEWYIKREIERIEKAQAKRIAKQYLYSGKATD